MVLKAHHSSPRKWSRADLELRYKRLQKEVLEISAREQQRIGQDLHDDLCQQLTAITLLTEVLEGKLLGKSLLEAADAGEIHQLIAQAIVQTRLLAKGLLPVVVTNAGLLSALEGLAASAEKLGHISCRTEGHSSVLIRDDEVAIQLFRIAQEAVANAAKHARARNIVISLREKGDHLILSVRDDGIGIPAKAKYKGRLGLSIMNSRAETINAVLDIRQGNKGGTVVTCSLRLPAGPVQKAAHRRTRK